MRLTHRCAVQVQNVQQVPIVGAVELTPQQFPQQPTVLQASIVPSQPATMEPPTHPNYNPGDPAAAKMA